MLLTWWGVERRIEQRAYEGTERRRARASSANAEATMADRGCVEPDRRCPFSEEVFASRLREIEQQVEKNNSLLRWGTGIVMTVFVTLGSLVYASLDKRVQTIETQGAAPMRERVARMESSHEALRRDIEDIKRGQQEIVTLLREAYATPRPRP